MFAGADADAKPAVEVSPASPLPALPTREATSETAIKHPRSLLKMSLKAVLFMGLSYQLINVYEEK